jgi:hypothetical protein
LILSDGQIKIIESLLIKKDKAIKMFDELTKNTNSNYTITKKLFDKEISFPSFLK